MISMRGEGWGDHESTLAGPLKEMALGNGEL